MKKLSRRAFNTAFSLGMGSLVTLPIACSTQSKKKDEYKGKKLGIALVGLGTYSTYELAPSLLETNYCRLAAIVTGTAEKEKKTLRQKSERPKQKTSNT